MPDDEHDDKHDTGTGKQVGAAGGSAMPPTDQTAWGARSSTPGGWSSWRPSSHGSRRGWRNGTRRRSRVRCAAEREPPHRNAVGWRGGHVACRAQPC